MCGKQDTDVWVPYKDGLKGTVLVSLPQLIMTVLDTAPLTHCFTECELFSESDKRESLQEKSSGQALWRWH